MKLITLFMSAFLLGNAFAAPEINSGLKTALDELNYGLAVEWDQKDQAVYEEKVASFKKQIVNLKEQGVSNSDLVEGTLSLVKDEKTKAELKEAISSFSSLSAEQAMKEVQNMSSKINAKGSSWNGETALVLIPGILIGALMIYIVATLATSKGENVPFEQKETVYTCEYRDTCFSMWGPGNDDLGFPVGSQTCGFQYVCGNFASPF